MMDTRWERRDEKKKRAWYKKHLHSNRKALEVIVKAREARLKRIAYDWYDVEYKDAE